MWIPNPWPKPGMNIKLFIIPVSEKSPIYDNRSCRARAGKPGNDGVGIQDQARNDGDSSLLPFSFLFKRAF
jgi:hypothetical protein